VSDAVPYALAQMIGWEDALYITNNRYQTAISAGDTVSANLQSAAFQKYLILYNNAAQVASADLTMFTKLLSAIGFGDQIPSMQDELDALAQLKSGDVSEFDSLLDPFGLTDSEIASLIDAAQKSPLGLPSITPDQALLNAADSLSVGAVPEPSTWAIMLIGFAGLGFAGYRRALRTA
jgi:PEP-CTERM motif